MAGAPPCCAERGPHTPAGCPPRQERTRHVKFPRRARMTPNLTDLSWCLASQRPTVMATQMSGVRPASGITDGRAAVADGHVQGRVEKRRQLMMLGIVLGLLLALAPPATPAHAANIVVNNLGDPNVPVGSCPVTCTLRNAITAANPGDTIQFSVTGTIPLNGKLVLTKNVTIQGPGASSLIIDGQTAVGVFEVIVAQVTFSGITIDRAGGVGGGMGIYNNNGSVTIANSVLSRNASVTSGGALFSLGGSFSIVNSTLRENLGPSSGGAISMATTTGSIVNSTLSNNSGGAGGAIHNPSSPLTILSSTFSGNVATESGGAIFGSFSNVTTVKNSTFSGNSAAFGGAIQNVGSMSVINSTFSGNSAGTGGAIRNLQYFNLQNSIVVASPAGGNCAGAITSLGNNLSDTAGCFQHGVQGNIVSPTPLLGPLALNAPGTTKTHALLPGSPAIDGVTFSPSDCPATVVTDQRGEARPQTWAGPRCDIGAYELAANTPPTINGIGTQSVNEDGPFPALFVTVNDAETPENLTVTGSSSNQTLIPNGNISVSSGGLFRSLTLTPAANQFGDATITLTVNDGFTTAQTAFLFSVSPVNDAPAAVNDTYTLNVGQPLNATVGSGVLNNDTDIDGPSLTALLVQKPAHGALILLPNGSFTYTPTGTYSGTDTFTYRASDGAATSAVATVTITVTPTACAPRPVVKTQLAVGGGKLLVRVEATPLAGRPTGPLRKLQFGDIVNAKVTVAGQTMANGQEYTPPGGATFVEFTVERIAAGQPTTVPLTVVDDCGSWKTLVGGGAGAGF